MRGTWWPKGEPYVFPRHVDPSHVAVIARVCTEREADVLKLKAHGYGRRRIALILGLSESTVRTIQQRAQRKVVKALELEEAA